MNCSSPARVADARVAESLELNVFTWNDLEVAGKVPKSAAQITL